MDILTEEKLIEAGNKIAGANLADLSVGEIERLMTITQYVTDCCLNELETRGVLEIIDGKPCVPYASEYMVETILTRPVA